MENYFRSTFGSIEKRIIQSIVVFGVLLLSLLYVCSVNWLPALRRKLQLRSEKLKYLKILAERQKDRTPDPDLASQVTNDILKPPEQEEVVPKKKSKSILKGSVALSRKGVIEDKPSFSSEQNDSNRRSSSSNLDHSRKDGLSKSRSSLLIRRPSPTLSQVPSLALSTAIPPSPLLFQETNAIPSERDLRSIQDAEYQQSLIEESAAREREEMVTNPPI